MERCDDIYEAIRFNESQECYQDHQPAAAWDAVSDDLMNKIQIKLLTSPNSCLMLVSCPHIVRTSNIIRTLNMPKLRFQNIQSSIVFVFTRECYVLNEKCNHSTVDAMATTHG